MYRSKRDGGGWRRGGVGCQLPAPGPTLKRPRGICKAKDSLKLQTTPCTAGGTVYSTRTSTSMALNIKHLYVAISGTLHWIARLHELLRTYLTNPVLYGKKSGHGVLKILPSSL